MIERADVCPIPDVIPAEEGNSLKPPGIQMMASKSAAGLFEIAKVCLELNSFATTEPSSGEGEACDTSGKEKKKPVYGGSLKVMNGKNKSDKITNNNWRIRETRI